MNRIRDAHCTGIPSDSTPSKNPKIVSLRFTGRVKTRVVIHSFVSATIKANERVDLRHFTVDDGWKLYSDIMLNTPPPEAINVWSKKFQDTYLSVPEGNYLAVHWRYDEDVSIQSAFHALFNSKIHHQRYRTAYVSINLPYSAAASDNLEVNLRICSTITVHSGFFRRPNAS